MTTSRNLIGARSNTESTIAVPMLYGRFPQAIPARSTGTDDQTVFVASAASTSTAGCDPATARNAGMSARSNSTASTRSAPRSASAVVSAPRPAPMSSTASPGPTPASAAIAAARFGSIRKCWPSAFDGSTPCRASSARGLPGERDVEEAVAERLERGEGFGREVDDPPRSERSSVIDDHRNGAAGVEGGRGEGGAEREPWSGAAGVEVGHGYVRAEREPWMGGGQPAPRRVVPRRLAGLGARPGARLRED